MIPVVNSHNDINGWVYINVTEGVDRNMCLYAAALAERTAAFMRKRTALQEAAGEKSGKKCSGVQPGLVPAGGVFAHDIAGSGISRAPAARANELVLAPAALAFDVSPIPQLLQYA